MTDRVMPSVFVSHGAPTIALADSPMRPFFKGLGEALGRPRGIVCISAHWEASKPACLANPKPQTIHDFKGFQDELYQIEYPAPGAPGLAALLSEHLAESSIELVINKSRGIDHGVWVPLMMMYPDADIPLTQLSVQTAEGPEHHVILGRALRDLRKQGILIIGSGSAVHNLQYYNPGSTDVPEWAQAFEDWLVERVLDGDIEALMNYLDKAPDARMAHPTPEHFFPLLTAIGASEGQSGGQVLHKGFMDGGLSMASFAFS